MIDLPCLRSLSAVRQPQTSIQACIYHFYPTSAPSKMAHIIMVDMMHTWMHVGSGCEVRWGSITPARGSGYRAIILVSPTSGRPPARPSNTLMSNNPGYWTGSLSFSSIVQVGQSSLFTLILLDGVCISVSRVRSVYLLLCHQTDVDDPAYVQPDRSGNLLTAPCNCELKARWCSTSQTQAHRVSI